MNEHLSARLLHHYHMVHVLYLLQSDIAQLPHLVSLLLQLPQVVLQQFAVNFGEEKLEIEFQIFFFHFVNNPKPRI